ncbi:MAG: AAA family ATPase [Armatimonadetes bacterium]|nr:AAA family ATPase [Armatimonadota bacterium]
MKLTEPIFNLKRKAKTLSRNENIPLHEALDRIAVEEGLASWSLLAAQHAAQSPASRIYGQLQPGSLLLLAARPGQGKTLLGLQLAVEAMLAGHRSFFFSLEYTEQECSDRFKAIGIKLSDFEDQFEFDGSDAICADYIAARLASAKSGTLAVIDYLQLLDQKRETPDLLSQIRALRFFAQSKGMVLIFISQVDRHFDPMQKALPDFDDVRLPNPLDLALFDRACFLHNGEVKVAKAS